MRSSAAGPQRPVPCGQSLACVMGSCLNERRGNAVGSQRQRSHSATRTPCARSGDAHDLRKDAAVAFARRPHGVYGDVTAPLPRPHDALTAFALRLHRISFIPLRPHGDHTELPRRSPESLAFAWRLRGVCTALIQRSQCVVSYDLQKRMAHKPLLWMCSTNSKYPTLIKIHLLLDVWKHLMPTLNKDAMNEKNRQNFVSH